MMYLFQALICIVVFVGLDTIWFKLFMRKFTIEQIGDLLTVKKSNIEVNIGYALGAYVCMVVAPVFFLFPRLSLEAGLIENLGLSFLFGFLFFGLFDLSSGALLRKYSWKFALVDMLWGGFIYLVAGFVVLEFALL